MNRELKQYFSAVPAERQALLKSLHALILGLYPQAEVDMSYRMPTYKAKDGWVAIANQKHHVSLYTCGAHHLVAFKQKYPHLKTGKGCIHFKTTDRLPVAELKKVIRHAIEHPT